MSVAITVRIPDDLVLKIELAGKQEHLDRSALIKKWLSQKCEEYYMKKAVDLHLRGRLTLEQAAKHADVSLWKLLDFMEQNKKVPYQKKTIEEEIEAVEHLF